MRGDIVIVDYADLASTSSSASASLLSSLSEAFGSSDSKGIVAIRNVPGFVEARDAFLPSAHALAHLPPKYLESELTDERSLYNAGWSRGKERLGGADKKPDLSKGSFYFNPLTDEPGTAEDRARYPASYPRNVWPTDDDGGDTIIPGFEGRAKALGRIMRGAVVALAGRIDAFAAVRAEERGSSSAEYPANLLGDAMRNTDKAKGRLLYYFPLDDGDGGNGGGGGKEDNPPQPPAEDSWIGWHNDSGFLTALAGDIYVDHETGRILDKSEVDQEAGLYAVDRTGKSVKVDIPDDCMAVQIGECTQIVTGGAVIATPHCVRASRAPGVARISCPCFIDAPPGFPLRSPGGAASRGAALDVGLGKDRVPPLSDRWTEEGMTFGDFLAKTFGMYYDRTAEEEGKEG